MAAASGYGNPIITTDGQSKQEVHSVLPSHDLNCVCSNDGSYVFVKNIKDLYSKENFGKLGMIHHLSLEELTDGIYTYLVLSKHKIGKGLRMSADKKNELYFMAIRVNSSLELLTKHMVIATLLRDIHELQIDDKHLHNHVVISGELRVETNPGDGNKTYKYNLESGTFMVDRYENTRGDIGTHHSSVWTALQKQTQDTGTRNMEYVGRTPFITGDMCMSREEIDNIARVGGEVYVIPNTEELGLRFCKKIKTDAIYQGLIENKEEEIQKIEADMMEMEEGTKKMRLQSRKVVIERQIERVKKTFLLDDTQRAELETYRYVPTGGVGGKRRKRNGTKHKRRTTKRTATKRRLRKRTTSKKRCKKSMKVRFNIRK